MLLQLKIKLHDCVFFSLHIGLSQLYNPGHEFYELTMLTQFFFFCDFN